MTKYKQRMKKAFNSRVRPKSFMVKDLVLRRVRSKERKRRSKQARKKLGRTLSSHKNGSTRSIKNYRLR